MLTLAVQWLAMSEACASMPSRLAPGSGVIRTLLSIEVIIAILFSRWGAQPYATYPFPYPETLAATASAAGTERADRSSHCTHPIYLAMKWRQMLDEDASLNMAQLARNQGVSRARVTQVMNLLALPLDVQAHLIGLQEPAAIRYFSEHKLRPIAACATPETQVHRFGELCQSFGRPPQPDPFCLTCRPRIRRYAET
jgi:hypothetical protein